MGQYEASTLEVGDVLEDDGGIVQAVRASYVAGGEPLGTTKVTVDRSPWAWYSIYFPPTQEVSLTNR